MTLQKKYDQLSTAISDSTCKNILSQSFKSLDDKETWLQAFAALDYLAVQNKINDETLLLLKECFRKGRENSAGFHLNDEDYAFLFQKIVSVLEAYRPHHIYATTCLALLYFEARQGYENKELAMQLLQQAASGNCIIASVIYNYYLYFGINCTEDKEKALTQLQALYNEGNQFAISYLSNVKWQEGNTDEAYALLQAGIQLPDDEYKTGMYDMLGLMEANAYNNIDKAIAYYNEALKEEGPYAQFQLGILYINGRGVSADAEKGQALLEKAFQYGVIDAGVFLGQHHNYNKNIDQAIHFFTKAFQYRNAQAALELAFIYLYNPDYKNDEKGKEYLDFAVKEKNHNAMIEMAWMEAKGEVYPKNTEHTISLLQECIDKKNGYAAYQLGRLHEVGLLAAEGTAPDYKKAFEYFCTAAEMNNVYGLEAAGKYFLEGYECEPDQTKALDYFRRAINMDSNYARYELALCYEGGRGVEKDYQQAFQLLQTAADANYAIAVNRLGYFYEDGLIGESNPEKAFEQYTKAAGLGYTTSYYELGKCYKYGTGVVENTTASIEWFTKCAESPSPNPYAWMELAHSYENGIGVEADQQKAFEYMTLAAEQNLPYAQYRLGYYYYFGMPEDNLEKAVEWLEKAHEGGSPWASLLLGEYHLYRVGEDAVPEKAFGYYIAAKEKNAVNEGLGACYEFGIGVEPDAKEAFNNYSIGAANKYPAALYRVALCYLDGRGVAKNADEAFINMKEAAEADQVTAMYELGMMYLKGTSTATDFAEATKWLTAAADNGSKYAQFELGNCYLLGKGVPEDETLAMHWFTQAAENGHEEALKIVGKGNRRNRR